MKNPAISVTQDQETRSPNGNKALVSVGLKAAVFAAPALARLGFVRNALSRLIEKNLRQSSLRAAETGLWPARVIQDRMDLTLSIFRSIERALAENRLSKAMIRGVVKILAHDCMLNKGEPTARSKFIENFKTFPPELLLISPTKFCNLECKGCYADSTAINEKLSWPVLDRLVNEVRTLWGSRFIVISGGEPLAYRDNGKSILDLVEKYPDVFFMMYTNATLIDDETARRIGKMGNLMPAISIEGMKEKTDARRGDGVFDKIVAAMKRLRREKVFFGLSITATKENADEVLSDRVIDFYFDEMGANFSWLFQYMPIGRAITLDLLPTPEQRLKLWKRSWDLIRDRQIFISDFWNGGSASHGCIAAGRSGGYMAVCWNGDVLSCAFMPYSPANVNTAYAEGRTLNDIWNEPFFQRVRQWQLDYGYDKKYEKNKKIRNWMMPCPMRDHFKEFHPILQNYQLNPIDDNARDALNDPDYHNGLIAYNKAVADLLDPIWENEYMDPNYKIPSK